MNSPGGRTARNRVGQWMPHAAKCPLCRNGEGPNRLPANYAAVDRPSARPACRLSRRFAAVAVAGLVVVSGCGRGQVPSGAGSGSDELRQAVEATLASKSFVMHL